MLKLVAAAGNETTKGSLKTLLATEGGAQEKRVNGGTGLIPERIALNAPVSSITETSTGYTVFSKAGTLTAKKVVLAMAPPLLNLITFSPPLPVAHQALDDFMTLSHTSKAIAIYDTSFWREGEGLSGQVSSDRGSTSVTFDNSPTGAPFGALMGFVIGD